MKKLLLVLLVLLAFAAGADARTWIIGRFYLQSWHKLLGVDGWVNYTVYEIIDRNKGGCLTVLRDDTTGQITMTASPVQTGCDPQ